MDSVNLLPSQKQQQQHHHHHHRQQHLLITNTYNQKQITNRVPVSCDGILTMELDEQKKEDQRLNQKTSIEIHEKFSSSETNNQQKSNNCSTNRNSNLSKQNELVMSELFIEETDQHHQQDSSLETFMQHEQNLAFNKIGDSDLFRSSNENKTTNKHVHNNNYNNTSVENFNEMSQTVSSKQLSTDNEIQSTDDCQNSIENESPTNNEDENDDESFIALCIDASNVLNNDPSRRYYINKLYQPLNSHTQEDQLLVEPDDEYLPDQFLRYLQSTDQELTKDRQRVQLTRILEDDDDGDDDQLDVRNQNHQDPLDRLQMTTIIETFESFPTSPLIDHSDAVNHLIDNTSCDSIDNNRPSIDKPDSTISNIITSSQSSSNNNRNCENIITSTDYNHPQDHQQSQFEKHNISLSNQDSHQNQFYSTINMDNNSTMDESQLINQEYNLDNNNHFQQNKQINHQYKLEEEDYNRDDNKSEKSFTQNQQVTSSFVSSTYDNHQSTLRVRHNQLTSRSDNNNQARKREFHQTLTDNHDKDITDRTKVRTKRRRSIPVNDIITKKYDDSNNHVNNNNNNKCYSHDKSNSTTNYVTSTGLRDIQKTNDYQEQHIKAANKIQQLNDDDDNNNIFMKDDDDSSSSAITGTRRNPHMNKYRRRTANARERIRMREINQAFEKLKKVVPVELIQQTMSGDESDQTSASSRKIGKSNQSQSGDSIKLTKITTLRLAVSYIAKLSEVLNQHQAENSSERTTVPIVPTNINQSSESTIIDKNKSTKKISRVVDKKKSKNKIISKNKIKEDLKPENPTLKQQSLKNDQDKITAINTNTQTIFFNQQQQPIIITNQYQPNTSTLVSLQQQQQQKPSQQLAYAQHCAIQQPLAISQGQVSNQDRTYVTPVAVAILGIPTKNSDNSNEPQGQIQLLGIQGAHQQTNNNVPSYNIITQHPQHVTLTLDDLNGLSVLRVANTNNNTNNNNSISLMNQNQTQTFQIHQNRPTTATFVHQQAQILSNGYNYTTYQPIQFSQIKPNTMNPPPTNQQQPTATIQFRNTTAAKFSDNNIVNYGESTTINQRHQNARSDKIMMIKSLENNNLTNTGLISDCRNINISPTSNTIAHSLNSNNNNNNNFLQTNEFRQSNFSNQGFQQRYDNNNSHPISIMVDTTQSNSQFIQNQQLNSINTTVNNGNSNSSGSILTTNNKNNLIYINSSPILNKIDQISDISLQQNSNNNSSNNNNEKRQFEQMKFVTQFQRQDSNVSNQNETNINQLVASLATSIQPKEHNSTGSIENASLASPQKQQQQQPHKKTYRFHNYDGNMITNNLYGSHDKNQQQYLQSQNNILNNNNKRINQIQEQSTNSIGGGQRSRQNSLSSTCSTISSSSSSLASSSSTSSPVVSIMIKSPTANENDNRSSLTTT